MSAVEALADTPTLVPANSNVSKTHAKSDRWLLVAFFAALASSMLAWIGALVWGLLWLVGWL